MRMPVIKLGAPHYSFVGFGCCFFFGFMFTYLQFPPTVAITPFNFILAYSIWVAALCSLFVFGFEAVNILIKARANKSTEWNPVAYAIYLLITIAVAGVAITGLNITSGQFISAKREISYENIGKYAKNGILNGSQDQFVNNSIMQVSDKELGSNISFAIIQKQNFAYIHAVEVLELLAMAVVIFYLVVDLIGARWGEKSVFRIIVIADIIVLSVHIFSRIAISYSDNLPLFYTFNASMIQSFCGGLMGFSLLAQVAVFVYVTSRMPSVASG